MPITFGQPFKAGQWQAASQSLSAKDSNGAAVPIQADEINSHVDGSVRFAVLSAQVANLQANQTRLVNFYVGSKTTSTPNVPAAPAWNMEIEAKVYNGNAVSATLVARPQDLLVQQIAQNKGRRLAGSVATEYTVVAPLRNASTNEVHPHLTARLHTRIYEGGARIRTDVVMENNWTFKASPSNITYDMTIKQNGQTVHTQPKLTHNHHARWHKVVWTGSAPQYRLRHNMPYFLDTKVAWNYNLGLNVPSSVLADEASALAASNTKPMGPAMVTEYFPMTGGRGDIGPLPRWTALYLVTQDDRARASMMANADAAGGVPIHYRDENTDQPLDVQRYPNVTVSYPDRSTPKVPEGSGSTEWTADRAHQPSFAYIPYLVTGDAYYLDETLFWASWNVATNHPDTRGGASGLINQEQMRGQAWAMRSLSEAAFTVPDAHPQRAYYKAMLANNINWYAQRAASTSQMSPLGALGLFDEPAATIPWQNDFMGMIFSRLAENNEPKARDVLNVISKFNVGRFMNDANGFCSNKGAVADMLIANPNNMQYFSTWSALFAANFASQVGRACSQVPMNEEAYPGDPQAYAAVARGALAAAANAGVANAAAAYTKWKAATTELDEELRYEPQFAIVPK